MDARLRWMAALAALCLCGCAGGNGDDGGDATSRTSSSPQGFEALTQHITALDPEGYRAEIGALEAALFGRGARSGPDPDAIAPSMRALGRKVSDEPIVLARALGAELLELADRADAGQDHATLVRQWTRIRDGLFESAPWFHGGAPTAMR